MTDIKQLIKVIYLYCPRSVHNFEEYFWTNIEFALKPKNISRMSSKCPKIKIIIVNKCVYIFVM